ncbi:MAG: hypothetical protein ACKO5K_01950 [Armatimonadota bacterium]
MGNKLTVPILVVVVVALIGFLAWWWGKSGMNGPSAATTAEAGLPPFIDPATQRPKGMQPGGATAATTGETPTKRGPRPGAPSGGAGAPPAGAVGR